MWPSAGTPKMRSQCFVDGGHLRKAAQQAGKPLVDPRSLAVSVAYSEFVQYWQTSKVKRDPYALTPMPQTRIGLTRVIYYDARPDDAPDPLIEQYWDTIQLLPDTEVGFGALRGRPRRRQKRVDGLIAVDMLTGAFTRLFDVAILVAGDADFVPIVDAVRRQGVMVVVAAVEGSLSGELKREADRVWIIDPEGPAAKFPPLQRPNDGKVWFEDSDGKVRLGNL